MASLLQSGRGMGLFTIGRQGPLRGGREGSQAMKFDRGPDGKFLSCGHMISVWLPALLDTSSSSTCMAELLRCTAVYCDEKAARRLERAAAAVRRQHVDWANRD